MIRAVIMDIDGVLTDGKEYVSGKSDLYKTISMKDLDALNQLREEGYFLAAITGEKNNITDYLEERLHLDAFFSACKDKKQALNECMGKWNLSLEDICYIGDGKYDIPVLEDVGLGICPDDATDEVKGVASYILRAKGGEGCIAETYSYLHIGKEGVKKSFNIGEEPRDILESALQRHSLLIKNVINNSDLKTQLCLAARMMREAVLKNHKILICGNGGSAADAQHFAAELVSRFYYERDAIDAEALTVNTSVLTAIANDYEYKKVFVRQLEAKGTEGDILVGITTSGQSENIVEAFKYAKRKGIDTVLLTGQISEYSEIETYADIMLNVPETDTPRIQEIHILFIHIICQYIEEIILERKKGV